MLRVVGEPFYEFRGKENRKYVAYECSHCSNESVGRFDWVSKANSCGCIRKSIATHGKSYSKEYKAWVNIKDRCYNKESDVWEIYGGSGIKMHDSWVESFEDFYAYVGDAPSKRHSIDRIDVYGDYVPGNVRWATSAQQMRNRGKFKRNTSGFTGVCKKEVKSGIAYTASVRRLDGTSWTKTFSVIKYGEEAFKMACEYREFMIKCLNEEGAGYTECHGK